MIKIGFIGSFLCKIGIHKWDRPIGLYRASHNITDWTKSCLRCGKEQKWLAIGKEPRSRRVFLCAECQTIIEHNNTCKLCGKHLCWLHQEPRFHICVRESVPSTGGKPGVVIDYTTEGWRGK